MGEEAWLVECEPQEVAALAAELRERPVAGQVSVRVGAQTVLVRVRRAMAGRAGEDLRRREPGTQVGGDHPRPLREIDVVYDGADLAPLAALLDMSEEALVSRHQTEDWTVAFCGFAPGFAYLRGWSLDVPRLDSPRSAVPAGSVAVAGAFSAIYPTASPGGWRLLGRTAAEVWDVDRDPPALLDTGDRVRYRAVRDVLALRQGRDAGSGDRPADAAGTPTLRTTASGSTGLTVVEPGPLTLLEDLGRGGLEHLGVSPSGAADSAAARLANRLVGNERSAALLETFGGLRLRADADLVVAVTGATVDVVSALSASDRVPAVDGQLRPDGAADEESRWSVEVPVPCGTPWAVAAGEELRIGYPEHGLRVYVAVRGGVEVPVVLGSRSTDVLGGLGPPALVAGTTLQVGRARAAVALPEVELEAGSRGQSTAIRVLLGPRDDVLDADGLADLTRVAWTVSSTSNRVGVRLHGGRLGRHVREELPSEPMVPGAIQLPPSGEPVILLRDHPVTGGYPVVGVVLGADLDRLAQARPGDRIELLVVPEA